jgi:Zn-dependent protease
MKYAHYPRKNRFSKIEIIDLIKSFLVIGVAFAIVHTGIKNIASINFLVLLIISLLTAGLGFILHELMHKFVAQKYGCWSEFRADNNMLMFGLLGSLIGFIFFAPGAVMIHGHITKRENGIISAAGPISNFVLAFLFLIIALLSNGIFQIIGIVGLKINSFIGLFNMIPFFIFDGKKIWAWNKINYIIIVISGLILLITSYKLF